MTTDAIGPYAGKRLFDVAIAGAACAALAPVVTGVAIAAWLADGGPPLFSQSRVGQLRRPFTLLKLRSMRAGQITRIGGWLRRTGIEELPQFVNVLRGDMSVVGPRPLTQADIDRLGWSTQRHDWRFAARPGITGLSQLLAGGGPRASERFDRIYLRRQNPLLDIQLVALSAAANVVGKRAVRRWLRHARLRATGTAGELPRPAVDT